MKFLKTNDIQTEKGFTLIEVMISLAIFSVFIVAFVSGQGYNIADSTIMKEENKLRLLAEQKIFEIIASPPDFTDGLTIKKEVKEFENDKDFTAKVIYKKLKIPDLSALSPKDNLEDEDAAAAGIEKKLFDNISKNLEKIIWQVEVTVENKYSKRNFSANSWLYNYKAKIKFDQF